MTVVMKNLKLLFTFILIVSIFFAGSCATKKKTFRDGPSSEPVGNTSQPIKPPSSADGTELFEELDDISEEIPAQRVAELPAQLPEELPAQRVAELPAQLPADELVNEFDLMVDADSQIIEELQSADTRSNDMYSEQSQQSQLSQSEESDTAGSDSEAYNAVVGDSDLKIAEAVISGKDVSGFRTFGSPGGPGGKERRNSFVVGPGSVNVEGVMDYIKIRNRNPGFNEENTRKIINSYIDEAEKEDVNYDFAIAQMLYWTAFLTHKQRVESNNLAGLQATNTWKGTFSTAEEGVRAHIQHLRAYSHRTLKDPSVKNIDPRWDGIGDFRGTIKNFEQIYPRWSQNTARYRRNIILILNDMYRYSDRYSSLYR